MCGICGIVYKNTNRTVSAELIKKMAETISHRGPDEEGIYVKGNVGLAHKRLSIIDLASGHQPMINEDKSAGIVFNGEIYNHELIKMDLLQQGHKYITRSDTETILHAYEEYGPKCLNKLRGMFAFAIYDNRKQLLFLARDRVGKKPLYYFYDGNIFIFASEIKALIKSGLIPKQVNKSMIDFYLSIGYVPGKETLFEGIKKLEPGQYLVLDDKFNITIEEYWDIINIKTNYISYDNACKLLKEKLLESVKIRLMSEVPLGVFLSGGLDSSAIVALMSQIQSDPIKTFSVGYKNEPKSNELGYAKIISNRFKTEHYEFYLSSDDLFSSIDTFLQFTEEPIVESAGIALYKLAKMAKSKATVMLSGEGADEILAGYPIYEKMRKMEKIYALMKIIPPVLINLFKNDKFSEKALKYIDWMSVPFKKRFRSLAYDLSPTIKEMMYTQEYIENLDNTFDAYFESLYQKITGSYLRKMLYIDTKTWLAEDILLKADRMTMAASVELRAPFLDHELMEFAFSMPDNYKLQSGQGKFILKDIMKDLLPNEIIFRQKKGFPVPLNSWFKGDLHNRAKDLLTNKKAFDRGYFNKKYIYGLFERIKHGEDLGRRIFSLVNLELWHQKYID